MLKKKIQTNQKELIMVFINTTTQRKDCSRMFVSVSRRRFVWTTQTNGE